MPWRRVKGKVHPRTSNEGLEGEQRYSSTISVTATLNWGVVNAMPRPLYPRERDAVPIVHEAGWARGPDRPGVENLAHTGIRSPDRPTRSQSLYRQRYRGPHKSMQRSKYVTPVLFKLRATRRRGVKCIHRYPLSTTLDGPRDVLEVLECRKIPCTNRDSNPRIVQPVA